MFPFDILTVLYEHFSAAERQLLPLLTARLFAFYLETIQGDRLAGASPSQPRARRKPLPYHFLKARRPAEGEG